MSSLNQVNLIGRLGQDPDSKHMPNGDAVCTISLATSESWKDKNTGEKKEATEWHRVVFFGRLAEVVGQYARKGGMIYVCGKLKTRKWQDKEGHDRYTTEINAHEMRLLGGKSDGDSGGGREQNNGGSRPAAAPAPKQQQAPRGGGGSSVDDDIPFDSVSSTYAF